MANELPIPSNADLLAGAHAPLMLAVKNGKAATLVGVALSMEGGVPSASITRDDDRQPVSVSHTAAAVSEWATSMVFRLIDERKTYEPTGGDEGGWGNPVLAENLSIIPKGGKNPVWRGIVGNDLWAQRSERRAAARTARIAENGGFKVDVTAFDESDIDQAHADKKALKQLLKTTYPSARKAAAAINRVCYGDDWHETDKAQRKTDARAVLVNARSGEMVVKPSADTTTEVAAATPATPANITKAALITRAEMLGVDVKKSWTKAQVSEAIELQMQALRDNGLI